MQALAYVPAELRAKLLAPAPSELELNFRPMFGGIMGYEHGRPFTLPSSVGPAFKLAGVDHAAVLALSDPCPRCYEPDSPPSRSSVLMPDRVLDDPAQLAAWARRCARYVAAQPAKKAGKPSYADKYQHRGAVPLRQRTVDCMVWFTPGAVSA